MSFEPGQLVSGDEPDDGDEIALQAGGAFVKFKALLQDVNAAPDQLKLAHRHDAKSKRMQPFFSNGSFLKFGGEM